LIGPKHLFWDSCVFIRYLTKGEGWLDIAELISDTKAKFQGERRHVYYSTLTYAEIRPRHFVGSAHGSLDDLLAELGAAFEPIDPNPNILKAAGELRDAVPVNPFPKEDPDKKRVISTPDSIHLMTCVFARDVLGVSDIVFQTFDNGKGSTWEGKCVPLLSFERWFPENVRTQRVSEVCSLPRAKPEDPEPPLPLNVADENPAHA